MSPGSAQVLVGDGSIACGTPHVVASGDTLSRVSERAYGDPMLYGFIADANWDALGGNPENIAVGMSLTIPCIDASGKVLTSEQAAEAASTMEAVVTAQGALTPEQLDTLFGPVALFPDQVLTPVLVAVTFPLDVVKAARFVATTADLTDQERAAQAADQPWDNSVRELAAGFPALVTRMSDNIDWTEQAGEAVVAQTDDVLASIQRLRAKAQDNGYLVDNEAQNVEKKGEAIVITSANPGTIYVPTYDPEVVYSTPVAGTPAYYYGNDYDDNIWDDTLVAGGIMLGTAVLLDEIFDDDDWNGWDIDDDIDWDRGDITIDRDINIDRGDIDIERGDRPIGGGDRISIGDSTRPQIDRGDLAGLGDRPRAGTLPANRAAVANTASREIARQKIGARQAAGAKPAKLQPSRSRASQPSAGGSRAATRSRPDSRAARISRPTTRQAPAARSPSRSSSFERSPSRQRVSASSSRGRASVSRGGGRGRGGRR